jgi:hypothetical protein
MASPESIFVESWDVNRRLADLGLNESDLLEAAERGFSAWASCTANHPPAIPGLLAWGETVCALRERLIPLGWERKDESNWPIVINKSGTIALSVATGNEDTGRKDNDPLTASAKGPRTVDAVVANQRQLVLFAEMLPPRETLRDRGRATWLLLLHRDLDAREMRCELSRPISMDDDGRVDGWAERIILTSRPFDGLGGVLADDDNGPQSPEITVEIKRRA